MCAAHLKMLCAALNWPPLPDELDLCAHCKRARAHTHASTHARSQTSGKSEMNFLQALTQRSAAQHNAFAACREWQIHAAARIVCAASAKHNGELKLASERIKLEVDELSLHTRALLLLSLALRHC